MNTINPATIMGNSKIEFGTSSEWNERQLQSFDDGGLSKEAKEAFVKNFSPDEFSRMPMKQIIDLGSRFEYVSEGFTEEEIARIVREELAHYQLQRLELTRNKVRGRGADLLDEFDAMLASVSGETLLFAISGDEEAITSLKEAFGDKLQSFSDEIGFLTTIDEDCFADPHLEVLKEAYEEASDVSSEYILGHSREHIIQVLQEHLTSLLSSYKGEKTSKIVDTLSSLLNKIKAGDKLTAVEQYVLLLYVSSA